MSDLMDNLSDMLSVLNIRHREVLTILRAPTPIKVVEAVQADDHGCIGNGLDTPNPVTLWECPMSHEAWLHRITVTSPQHPPATPLTQGEAYLYGSTGQLLTFLPHRGDVAPVQLLEGRLSAPHVMPGERVQIVADQLPPYTTLRFDFSIVMHTGTSEFAPLNNAPMRLRAPESVS